jgi:DNA-binding MarR family transcriptional regulator
MADSGVVRGILILAILLMMSGFFNYYLMNSDTAGQAWVMQDLSPSAESGSVGAVISGVDLGIGTLVLLRGDLASPIVSSAFFAVSATTLVADRRQDRTTPLRERIVEAIDTQPGIHLRGLQRSVDCAMGAVQYHLRVLEEHGLVMSLRIGNARHFFMANFSSDSQLLQVAAALRNPTVAAIVEECMTNGRVTQADLSRSLSLDKSLVSYYVGSLIDMDILRTIRTFGRERPLMLTEWAASILHSLRT